MKFCLKIRCESLNENLQQSTMRSELSFENSRGETIGVAKYRQNFVEKPRKARKFVEIRLHYFCTILYQKILPAMFMNITTHPYHSTQFKLCCVRNSARSVESYCTFVADHNYKDFENPIL